VRHGTPDGMRTGCILAACTIAALVIDTAASPVGAVTLVGQESTQLPVQQPAAPAGPAAQPGAPSNAAAAGAQLTVYHAVFGPGEQVWEKFGHNAIWIHDAASGSAVSYNYGMFSFDQIGFVPRLMRGDMLYSMGVRDADEELAVYAYYDRSVTVQRLNLTPEQRFAMREFLEWNWLEENRDYIYDYFRDNCSTRVRDVIDLALGGALSRTLIGTPTGTTFRWHSLRLTAGSTPTVAGLMLGLGPPTDEPIDAWEESFIPMQLMHHLRSVRVVDESGDSVPLVAEERVLYAAGRPAEAAEPQGYTLVFLLAGLLGGGGFALLGRLARRSRRGAFALAASFSVWGVVTGFFGLILFLLWAATNHVYSYQNLNLLQVNPLGFLLAVAAPLAVIRRITGRGRAVERLAWPAAVSLAFLSAAGLLLHILPVPHQENGAIIALLLPIHVGSVLALYQTLPRGLSPAEDGPADLRLKQTT
jgi:hypothetical protein